MQRTVRSSLILRLPRSKEMLSRHGIFILLFCFINLLKIVIFCFQYYIWGILFSWGIEHLQFYFSLFIDHFSFCILTRFILVCHQMIWPLPSVHMVSRKQGLCLWWSLLLCSFWPSHAALSEHWALKSAQHRKEPNHAPAYTKCTPVRLIK